RYVIQENEEGQPYAATNPDANGNAWFVENLRAVPDADAEILALDSLDTRNEAVFNASRFPDLKPATFARDSTAAITLEEYRPNQLTYHSSNSGEGLAVFSEMYYPEGWQAYLDGNKVSHFRVNYVLRALT